MIKVSVKDFGPISEGAVNLKPLTIFVGPSNAGKSYLAMLIYSLMQAFKTFSPSHYSGSMSYERPRYRRVLRNQALLDQDIESKITGEIAKNINNWARDIIPPNSLSELDEIEILFKSIPEEVQGLVNQSIRKSLQPTKDLFSKELLQRYYGDISDLRSRRKGVTNFQLSLEQSEPLLRLNFRENQGSLRTLSGKEWDLSPSNLVLRGYLAHLLQRNVARRSFWPEEMLQVGSFEILEALANSALSTLFEEFPWNCYYLPAARSGIAQGHKAIAGIIVKQSSLAAIRPLEVPTLAGIITDFMERMLTMETAKDLHPGPRIEKMAKVVDFLEKEVVRGKIHIEQPGEITYPEILYEPIAGQPNMGKFPLQKTSSMVSELAPVILFLKHLVRPKDLVILEEPESHLHPASQRQMARGIARLVNAGVKVITTTHSDYFIGQINNLLKLNRVNGQKQAREGYEAADCLSSDDVGAYYFQLDKTSGSSVRELEIFPDFGIDEQEFSAVSEALYEETILLQNTKATGHARSH